MGMNRSSSGFNKTVVAVLTADSAFEQSVRSTFGASAVFAVSVLAHTPAPSFSGADDIYVMTSGAFTAAFKVLAADWERSTGHKVITINGSSMGAAPTTIPNRLARGEQADVVILARSSLDALANDGKVVNGSQVDLADSRIAMAVRTGAPTPSISSVEQFRQVLLDARSISISQSASGVYISSTSLISVLKTSSMAWTPESAMAFCFRADC